MNILTSLATILRPTSKPEGIFVIRPGTDAMSILQQAEDWSLEYDFGATVLFMPGIHTLHETFEFYAIGAIIGCGMKSTRIRRLTASTLFSSVWDYAEIDHAPEIGNFEIKNEFATANPAIELGGCQNAHVHSIYSWGEPADLLCFTNCEPTPTPPEGKPFGTWTENITVERVVVYSPRSAAIRFRCTDPQKRGQSFSHLRLQAQITLTQMGSIGIDFESHCHVYAGSIFVKGNIDVSANGDATMINVGPECNLCGNDWQASFVEGVPLYGPNNEVIRPAGLRIRVASSARVSGHGKFYRQRESHTPDEITPGVNYAGERAGFVEGSNPNDPILADEGI